MIDQNRLRLILFHAFALYLATSFVQLHAKVGTWSGTEHLSVEEVSSFFRRQLTEVARVEQDQSYFFAPGN